MHPQPCVHALQQQKRLHLSLSAQLPMEVSLPKRQFGCPDPLHVPRAQIHRDGQLWESFRMKS